METLTDERTFVSPRFLSACLRQLWGSSPIYIAQIHEIGWEQSGCGWNPFSALVSFTSIDCMVSLWVDGSQEAISL